MKPYKLEIDDATDIGCQKVENIHENQDYCLVHIPSMRPFTMRKFPFFRETSEERIPYILATLADGHGHGGEVASRLACVTVISELEGYLTEKESGFGKKKGHQDEIEELIIKAMKKANEVILDKKEESLEYSKMGTTLDLMLFMHTGDLYIGHIGDGRVYRADNSLIYKLTTDHCRYHCEASTYEQEIYLTFQGQKTSPDVLGKKENPNIEIIRRRFTIGDQYLMATDGIYNTVTPNEMCAILNTEEDAALALVNKSNKPEGVLSILKEKGIFDGDLLQSVAGADNASSIVIKICREE